MRILLLSHLFPKASDPRHGIFVQRQAERLRELGHEIVVVVPVPYLPAWLSWVPRWRRYRHQDEPHDRAGFEVHMPVYVRPPGAWFLPYQGLGMYCGAGGLIRRLHRDKAFDVLFAEDASGDVAAGARVAHELGIPCVGMVIGRDLNDCSRRGRAYRNAIARGLEACDAVVCNSEPLATLVGELTGGRQRGVVISRGVDVGLLRPAEPGMRSALRNELGLPGGELVVYAGYLEREKGVYELLEAFLRVRGSHPGASLLLAGTGAERPGLARLVAGAGAKERVSFLGHVDHDRMPRLLQACDIAVMPSWHEGMPNAVVEAIACGLPVIATRVGGIPAAVRHGESGLLVPPRDPVALAAALSDLLKDASKRAQFGHEARLIAEARFDARANAGRLADLLEGTVRAYRRGATTSGRAPRRG